METPLLTGGQKTVVQQLSLTRDCEGVIDLLDKCNNNDNAESSSAQEGRSLHSEISTLRKFAELLDKVRRAQPPRAQFEERLWERVTVLIVRCRGTLGGVERFLRERDEVVEGQKGVGGAEGSLNYPQRTHINLQTKTLQLTLLAFNL